jgi:hypothetical protein
VDLGHRQDYSNGSRTNGGHCRWSRAGDGFLRAPLPSAVDLVLMEFRFTYRQLLTMHQAPRTFSRRNFLHASGAGVSLLALTALDSHAASSASNSTVVNAGNARKVILLSMSGPFVPSLYPRLAPFQQHLSVRESREADSAVFARFTSFGGVSGAALLEAADVEGETADVARLYRLADDDRRMASFGRSCLTARRLIERGVVQVRLEEPTSADLAEGLSSADRARWTQRPLLALLTDLGQRGMLDSTRVIWMNRAGVGPGRS